MESSQNAANEKASRTLVAYMSLETMFPDTQVRALAEAAGKGNVSKIKELVAKGIDINSKGVSNVTPLFWAIERTNAMDRKGYRLVKPKKKTE